MPIIVGLSVVGRPSRVKVATVSPKPEGFLREPTQQPSLKLRYRFYESAH